MRFGLINLAALALPVLSGCTEKPEIHLQSWEKDDSAAEVVLRVSADIDVLAIARDKIGNTPVGVMHICGFEDRYGTVQYLPEPADTDGGLYIYTFRYPSDLRRQVVSPPGGAGEITMGWPQAEVLASGVCFQIRGGAIGISLRSNIIDVPDLAEALEP